MMDLQSLDQWNATNGMKNGSHIVLKQSWRSSSNGGQMTRKVRIVYLRGFEKNNVGWSNT